MLWVDVFVSTDWLTFGAEWWYMELLIMVISTKDLAVPDVEFVSILQHVSALHAAETRQVVGVWVHSTDQFVWVYAESAAAAPPAE